MAGLGPGREAGRQVRALCDGESVTVYQAYSAEIGEAAVARQRLDASPAFSLKRMTWIKPSWCWMMYRSGYSFKDAGQARILAIRMKRCHFLGLLERAEFTTSGVRSSSKEERGAVKVQWDPERSPSLEKLPNRSIQVGIPPELIRVWVNEWVLDIQDVTDIARALKLAVEENPRIESEELVRRGLVPREVVVEVPLALQERLRMM